MTLPEYDPAFPNRPITEDFQLLSEVANHLDKAGETNEVDKILDEFCDSNSMYYFVQHRVENALETAADDPEITFQGMPRQFYPAVMAAELDGFAIGVEFAKRKYIESLRKGGSFPPPVTTSS